MFRFFYFFIFLFSACVQSGKQVDQSVNLSDIIHDTLPVFKSKIKYANGFTIETESSYKKVIVFDSQNKSKKLVSYVLVEKGKPYTATTDDIVIEVPLQSIACVSTTHLPFITLLNLQEHLCGFGGIKHIKNKSILERVKENKIKEIGFDHSINTESLISLNPSALMVYPYEGMNFTSIDRAGIKLLYNAEYLELNPLGKAEWIKFVAAFFNKEREADIWFNQMESSYLQSKSLATTRKTMPTIFSGKSFKGEWHMPGGKSFSAQFLYDAGANYLWKNDEHNNVLTLSFESVLEKAIDAEWWLIVGSKNGTYTLNDLLSEDQRYENFSAFKNKKVLYCNTLQVDYFGDGVAEPDIILKDLIFHLHPQLKIDHSPRYFKLLE